jgi:hypothetical protein
LIEIKELAHNKSDLINFINLPWKLYQGDPYWVPPIKSKLMATLLGKDNKLFDNGPHTFFMAYENGNPLARALVGINEKLNKKTKKKEGYISLFETVHSEKIAMLIFAQAIEWLKKRDMNAIVGPVSPDNGDSNRGLLYEGFNGSPVIMNVYNPPYYKTYFENYHFTKYFDLLAYYFDLKNIQELPYEKFTPVIQYAMKKYKYRVDKINLANEVQEKKDLKKVIDLAMPEILEFFIRPNLEELSAEINRLKPYLDHDLAYIARAGNKPIGFLIGFPDYHQVIKKLNGNLSLLSTLKYLWYRNKIDGMRVYFQMVIPEYQNKAVVEAMYWYLFQAVKAKKYSFIEGSLIRDDNEKSKICIEKAGGKLYRIYRVFRRNI